MGQLLSRRSWQLRLGLYSLLSICLLAGAGSPLLAKHTNVNSENKVKNTNVSHDTQADIEVNNPQDASSSPAVLTPLSPATGDDAPNVTTGSAHNQSSTTITVNGQTTRVDGNASYDNTYVSDDGAEVTISVHNSSSSTSDKEGGADTD